MVLHTKKSSWFCRVSLIFNSNLIWIHKRFNEIDNVAMRQERKDARQASFTRTWMKWSKECFTFYDNFAIEVRQKDMQILLYEEMRATHSINPRVTSLSTWIRLVRFVNRRKVVACSPRPLAHTFFSSDKLEEIMWSRSSENFLIKRHCELHDCHTFQFQMSKLIIANCVHLKKEHRKQLNEWNPVFRHCAMITKVKKKKTWRRRNWQVNRLAQSLEMWCRVTNKMCMQLQLLKNCLLIHDTWRRN